MNIGKIIILVFLISAYIILTITILNYTINENKYNLMFLLTCLCYICIACEVNDANRRNNAINN